jgi:hypothetical protein
MNLEVCESFSRYEKRLSGATDLGPFLDKTDCFRYLGGLTANIPATLTSPGVVA